MKALRRMSWGTVTLSLLIGLAGSFGGPAEVAQAATSPSLGAAATFSILGNTAITDAGTVVIGEDVGMNASGASITGLTGAEVAGTIFATDLAGPSEGIIDPAVQADTLTAFGALDAGANADANCIGGVLADNTDLSALSPLVPGLYCSAGNFLLTGNLTLTGTTGTWVFKTGTGLITSPGSTVTGGDACNVWWRVGSLATLAGTSFKGTIISGTGVHFTTGGTLDGRALAKGGDVTMVDGTAISGPACAAPSPSSGSSSFTGTITVVKNVVNDNGRTKVAADFPLFIDGNAVVSGVSNAFSFFSGTAHAVTETGSAQYARSFSGDCDASGGLFLDPAENLFCIVTNDDIGAPVVVPPVPPLIDVVKVPDPLALPAGPGPVTYTYTARNIGTVPMTDVTLVGDTCAPIALVSGDVDGDNRLDVDETWVHTCSTTLSETHTNTVVATGWANGLSAVDIASATVVVGVPAVPPLIHVTKVPSPLTLLAGGGTVTYTKKVTNPGTVPLENVRVTDDKCSPVALVSGDADGDAKLDPSETWTFTCSSNLTKTTTNTAVAVGEANGFTVRDFAIATVVVAGAVPSLPNTGTSPAQSVPALAAVAALFAASGLLFARRKKQAR